MCCSTYIYHFKQVTNVQTLPHFKIYFTKHNENDKKSLYSHICGQMSSWSALYIKIILTKRTLEKSIIQMVFYPLIAPNHCKITL